MKRVILDAPGLNWVKRVIFTPGAVIRVLTQDDIARVADIVVLKKSGAPDEEDLVLEVTPAPVASESATDTAPATDGENDAPATDGEDTAPRRRRNPFM